MDDLANALGQILSSPEGLSQLRQVAAALGLGGTAAAGGNAPAGAAPAPPGQGVPTAAPSFATPPATAGSAPDLSALAALLGGVQQPVSSSGQAAAATGTAPLASMLGGLLGGGQAPASQGAQAGGLDLRALGALQKAFSTFNQSDPNIELLRALKGHFSPERAKKVDDAIRIMQLIKLLPLIKESGLLGGDPT